MNTSSNSSSGLDGLSQRLQQAVQNHQRRLQSSTALLVRRVTEARQQLHSEQTELERRLEELPDASENSAGSPLAGSQLADVLARLEEQVAGFDSAAGRGDAEGSALREENTRLTAEVDSLRDQLERACGADADGPASAEDAERIAELEAALAAAEQEREDLRLQNEELAGRVASSRMNPSDAKQSSGPLSWEQQKQLLLKQLESEDGGDSASATTSAGESVEAFVERTQKLLADRDAELAELRQLLAAQADASSGVAVGAAAIADMLDQDELVREERQKLQEIQKQWQEKLRAAEIELSLERAQLSRQRIEMEERIAKLADDEARLRTACAEVERAEGAGSRRWLARLGLNKDADGDE